MSLLPAIFAEMRRFLPEASRSSLAWLMVFLILLLSAISVPIVNTRSANLHRAMRSSRRCIASECPLRFRSDLCVSAFSFPLSTFDCQLSIFARLYFDTSLHLCFLHVRKATAT
jgi:hypothetical protein